MDALVDFRQHLASRTQNPHRRGPSVAETPAETQLYNNEPVLGSQRQRKHGRHFPVRRVPGAMGPASGDDSCRVARHPRAHKRRLAAAAQGMGQPQDDDVERTGNKWPKAADSAGPNSGLLSNFLNCYVGSRWVYWQ